MTEPTPLYSGEAILRGRGESDKSGQWIRLELSDAGGVHPFKGYEGERFMVVCVPIGNDDKPMTKQIAGREAGKAGGASTREDGGAPRGVAVQPPATKPKRHWRDMPPSQRAALMTKDPEFQAFACECFDPDAELRFDECTADSWLKAELKIESKADIWGNSFAVAKLEQIEGNFRAWQQAKQHGAA